MKGYWNMAPSTETVSSTIYQVLYKNVMNKMLKAFTKRSAPSFSGFAVLANGSLERFDIR